MDITAAGSAAASGSSQNAITLGLISSTRNLAAVQAAILMASLGVGNNVDSYA
jgi:hypothetical protein